MRPELHPACAVFPALPDKDLQDLADDIRQNGLRDPITLTPDDLLLDGKARWDACGIAGVEPRTIIYDGRDPIAFVLSKNKHRRHLTASQKAMIVARLSGLQHGSNQHQRKKEDCVVNTVLSAEELAKQSGDVARAYVNYGRTILRKGEPHIVKMVDDGKINIRVAAEAVRLHDRAAQDTMTTADVEREGRKVINGYPSNRIRTISAGRSSRAKRTGSQAHRYPLQTHAVADAGGNRLSAARFASRGIRRPHQEIRPHATAPEDRQGTAGL